MAQFSGGLAWFLAPDAGRNRAQAYVRGERVEILKGGKVEQARVEFKKIAQALWLRLTTTVTLIIWVVSSVLVTLAGPFGTYASMPLPLRAGYWSTLIGVSIVMAYIARAAVHAVMQERGTYMLREFVISVVFATTFVPVLLLLRHIATDAAPLLNPFQIFMVVLLVTWSVSALRLVLGIDDTPQDDDHPRLFRRIPDYSGAEVLRMTVNDHYVEVFLEDGDVHRLLMRFSDAVDELEGKAGFLIHRSHWVTIGAIEQVLRDRGRDFVLLRDGTRLPVSRTYRANLIAEGLIDPSVATAAMAQ